MKIQQAALVAEIVGAVAVVISLLFVGVQLRSNARVMEAQAVFELRQSIAALQRDLTTNAELSSFLYRAYNDYSSLSAEERFRFDLWVGNVLNTYVGAWKHGTLGLVDDEDLRSWDMTLCRFLERPGARVVWDEGRRDLHRADFRQHVESVCGLGS